MPQLTVEDNDKGERLDKVVAMRLPQHSRVTWQTMIKQGLVTLNGNKVAPRTELHMGDIINYEEPENNPVWLVSPENREGVDQSINIIYEDKSVLVINKPAGLVTHPAYANTEDSVVHRILAHDKSIRQAVYDPLNQISQMRPGIVHRLDKDTSGVLIVAKTKDAMTYLANQIQNHKVTKTYLALCFNHLEQTPWTVQTWINRDKGDRRKMAVSPANEGREAKTIFTVQKLLQTKKGERATLTEVQPITGRTHQIRVHARHIGHPVLGDQAYATNESQILSEHLGLKRQFLHAFSLTIRLPGFAQPSTFEAPLPEDLQHALDQLSTTA